MARKKVKVDNIKKIIPLRESNYDQLYSLLMSWDRPAKFLNLRKSPLYPTDEIRKIRESAEHSAIVGDEAYKEK